jgi:hypothetical protein
MTADERQAAAFTEIEDRLREIVEPLRSRLVATRDRPGDLALEVPGLEGKPWGYVVGIRRGKRYVSYYLMSVYAEPAIAAGMSPELRRRMQGKSCFNFTKIDAPLLAELEDLTRRGYERTAGDPAWGVAKRVEHGMAYRRAMSTGTPQRRSGSQPSHGQQHASGG